MPLDVSCDEGSVIELDDFVDAFNASKVDLRDENSMLDAAKPLKALANNKQFLADVIYERISSAIETEKKPDLGVHTVVICRLRDGHYLRAVIWPAEVDDSYCRTGGEIFYYGMPHDHNFHFLTVGYHGPGYRSDYYEVDCDTSGWHPGKAVELTSVGRKQLHLGSMMLYRAFRDVHSQLPPADTSISLNIMANPPPSTLPNQHVFNLEADKISAIMQSRTCPSILSLIGTFLPENASEQLLELADRHDDALVSFYALRSLALSRGSEPERAAIFERGARHSNRLVQNWCRQYLEVDRRPG